MIWHLVKWGTDTGFGQYQGTVSVRDGNLVLRRTGPDLVKQQYPGDVPDKPLELLPVPWGKRMYLLKTREPLSFCNAINLGLEPRAGWNGASYVCMKISERAMKGAEEPRLEQADGVPKLPG
jgi:hypothetical protein